MNAPDLLNPVRSAGVAPARQMALDLGPGPADQLDDFEPGRNLEVLAWLHGWPQSASPGRPAYLWGPQGSGKTHLLRGLAAQALGQGWQVLWLDSRGVQSWSTGHPAAPCLVLMDDCERLDAQQQHWAFTLFIECASAHAALASGHPSADGQPQAIVAAGRCPPVDLPVRDDLRTRLGWGLIFGVEPLDEAGVREVLLRECRRRGLRLADGVLPYILTHFSRNLGFLMALLERLDRYALAEQRVLTIPLIKDMLAQETA